MRLFAKQLGVLFSVILIVVSFQNCSGGFQSSSASLVEGGLGVTNAGPGVPGAPTPGQPSGGSGGTSSTVDLPVLKCVFNGRQLTANNISSSPNYYKTMLGMLQPGDTLTFAPGTYDTLVISGVNGLSTNCIALLGQKSGAPAIIGGVSGYNTVSIRGSSFITFENFTVDGRRAPSGDGIKFEGSPSHDVLIKNNTLQGFDGDQQTVGISTKMPVWGVAIVKNSILSAGTGIYLGNSDGTFPFVGGLVDGNLVSNPVGYCMQSKFQGPRPTNIGLPTGNSKTIIRNNVFIKNNDPSPQGNRPNLLVGGFPSSGPGSNDMYEIYGNLLYHNPHEALFQGSGRISFHDNIMIDGEYTAIEFKNHDLPLKLVHFYNNTIYTSQAGVRFDSPAPVDAVYNNLIFAAQPLVGSIANHGSNITDTLANAGKYVKSPSMQLGSMNFFPLPGQVTGSPLNTSALNSAAGEFAISAEVDYSLDFNSHPKGALTSVGAYAEGTAPAWQLDNALKP